MIQYNFPSFEKKMQAIEFLKTCNLQLVSNELLLDKLALIIDGHTLFTLKHYPGLLLYRGIKYSEKPEFYEQIIYPPKHLAKMGRVNEEGKQMFYCSNLKKAPLYELFLKKGDKIALSTWMLDDFLLSSNVGYSKDNLDLFGAIRPDPLDNIDLEDQCIKKSEFDIISNFLSQAFCKKVNPDETDYYKLTNAIAKKFLTEVYIKPSGVGKNIKEIATLEDKEFIKDSFESIYYPTIQNNANDDNFAISSQCIDRGILKLIQIEYVEILDIIDNRYQYKILDIATELDSQKIKWKNLQNNWIVFDDSEELYFTNEFGKFEAYTSNGERVEPNQ